MTVLPPKNPPNANDPNLYYSTSTFNFQLNEGDSQIAFLPVQVAFRPATLILSDPSNTTIETTCNAPADIQGNSALWNTETSAGRITIPGVITAVRITNIGSGSIQAVMAT
jgi:hypothetical protein